MMTTHTLAARSEYHALSAGDVAFDSLARDQNASVIGVTSRGAFVHIQSSWVIFLSFESHRGPLTVALGQDADDIRAVLRTGASVQTEPGKLIFPDARIAVVVQPNAVWHQPPPVGPARPAAARLAALKFFAERALAEKSGLGLSPLLPPLLGMPSGAALPHQLRLSSAALDLRDALASKNANSSVQLVGGMIGRGQGLTPSGDDFVIGLLLALNRWGHVLWPDGDLQRLNSQVTAIAFKNTTTLSANLIECAAGGESDERLVAALDSIMTGQPAEADCVSDLLGWGNSSGVDALAGMAVAVTI